MVIDLQGNTVKVNDRHFIISEENTLELEEHDMKLCEASKICSIQETPRERGYKLINNYKLNNPEVGSIKDTSHEILITGLIHFSSPCYIYLYH